MLHLLPLRLIAKVLLYATTFGALGAAVAGWLGPQHIVNDAFYIMRLVLAAEAVLVLGIGLGWSLIPGFTNRIYPDISGTWGGYIHYGTKDDPRSKEAVLHVHQDMMRIRLILETDESQSETIVALPDTDVNFSRFKLFYIFENTRKEAVRDGPGEVYRGTAFIEMGPGRPSKIDGSYFTDQKKTGTISFSRDIDINIKLGIFRKIWLAFLHIFAPRGVSPYLGSRKYGP